MIIKEVKYENIERTIKRIKKEKYTPDPSKAEDICALFAATLKSQYPKNAPFAELWAQNS